MFKPNQMKLADYLNTTYSCTCGREHSAPIKQIIIEEDALREIPAILTQASCTKAFILYDATTYSVAGQQIETILAKNNLIYSAYVLSEPEPIPDEKTIGEVLIRLDSSCDMIIAVGSGTLNDVCRFISFKLHLPYIIVATAPSMDGFASGVTPLIVDHMKTTYEAQVPYAIVGDINILKEAPMEMIAAGIGDILGKYTCLCDWEVAHILLGEYHCNTIVDMVNHSLLKVTENIEAVKSREPMAIKGIMEALVLSGIAMSFAGNSRPASGSEHHLSHYWEMMFLFQNKKPILHGVKVGITTVAVLKAYSLLFEQELDIHQAKERAKYYSEQHWEELMKDTYGEAAPSVIALEQKLGKNTPDNVIGRLELLEDRWLSVKEVVQKLPSADHIRSTLEALHAPADPLSIGIDKTTFINSFLVAKELRNRFGLLQIIFDLGLSEALANEVWKYFYPENQNVMIF